MRILEIFTELLAVIGLSGLVTDRGMVPRAAANSIDTVTGRRYHSIAKRFFEKSNDISSSPGYDGGSESNGPGPTFVIKNVFETRTPEENTTPNPNQVTVEENVSVEGNIRVSVGTAMEPDDSVEEHRGLDTEENGWFGTAMEPDDSVEEHRDLDTEEDSEGDSVECSTNDRDCQYVYDDVEEECSEGSNMDKENMPAATIFIKPSKLVLQVLDCPSFDYNVPEASQTAFDSQINDTFTLPGKVLQHQIYLVEPADASSYINQALFLAPETSPSVYIDLEKQCDSEKIYKPLLATEFDIWAAETKLAKEKKVVGTFLKDLKSMVKDLDSKVKEQQQCFDLNQDPEHLPDICDKEELYPILSAYIGMEKIMSAHRLLAVDHASHAYKFFSKKLEGSIEALHEELGKHTMDELFERGVSTKETLNSIAQLIHYSRHNAQQIENSAMDILAKTKVFASVLVEDGLEEAYNLLRPIREIAKIKENLDMIADSPCDIEYFSNVKKEFLQNDIPWMYRLYSDLVIMADNIFLNYLEDAEIVVDKETAKLESTQLREHDMEVLKHLVYHGKSEIQVLEEMEKSLGLVSKSIDIEKDYVKRLVKMDKSEDMAALFEDPMEHLPFYHKVLNSLERISENANKNLRCPDEKLLECIDKEVREIVNIVKEDNARLKTVFTGDNINPETTSLVQTTMLIRMLQNIPGNINTKPLKEYTEHVAPIEEKEEAMKIMAKELEDYKKALQAMTKAILLKEENTSRQFDVFFKLHPIYEEIVRSRKHTPDTDTDQATEDSQHIYTTPQEPGPSQCECECESTTSINLNPHHPQTNPEN
ncbi:hypothetical protein NEDG_01355 [Nematocida displodere]|uniref:Uncharacterized protein n=1 Tax=Nematocida displodere TaxID=1805483 RepID=A0A177EDP3_9MICR|nr:hypothetical protein NEDG_01355 [Nematocida displodere]